MKLPAKLAYSQIKINRNRTIWTLAGIVLSAAMLTAVFGFAASAKASVDAIIQYDYEKTMYNASLYAMAAVLGTIIVVTSVIVISSAFRISAGERTRQFGILKSVGATKKQIAQTVLYEGVFLCVAGIPCGVALGLAVELGATSIGERLLQNAGSVAHFFSCSRPPRFCSRRRSRSARYCSRHGFPRAKPQG